MSNIPPTLVRPLFGSSLFSLSPIDSIPLPPVIARSEKGLVAQLNSGVAYTAAASGVADVEAASGLTIPLPAGVDKKAKPALWAVDFKAVAAAKKTLCKGDPGND